MKRTALLTLLIALTLAASAQLAPGKESVASGAKVNWISFEEAVEKSQSEKRPIFIDVYTDWCGYCKVMDKNTFTNPEIARLLNEEYYAVKFNAEQREPVTFRGTTFKFVPSGRGGYHELAASLLSNQLSYPNFVFLTEDFRIVPVIPGRPSLPGYRKPEEFHIFLQYVADKAYKQKLLAEYQKTYDSPYTPNP